MACNVCGSKMTTSIFNPGPQPLAALNLPRNFTDAVHALRFPMDFHLCTCCSHVFNDKFSYAQVPYSEDSNLMYNSGSKWLDHIGDVASLVAMHYPDWCEGTAIDIGSGDGLFFSKLHELVPEAKLLGYEPGIDGERKVSFPVIRDYFVPERDLTTKTSLLCCRHVVEHLANPREFVEEIAYWCGERNISPLFLVEVPCFDNSLNVSQASDLLYEHVSNFTTTSFKKLFNLAGYSTIEVGRHYRYEVLVGVFAPLTGHRRKYSQQVEKFKDIEVLIPRVQDTLDQLSETHTVLFWGGTGKGAAFLNTYQIDRHRFSYVTDSDERKVGRYVPGTGQLIQPPDAFRDAPELAIVITTAWRAHDIKADIERRGLKYSKLLVLDNGRLVEYGR